MPRLAVTIPACVLTILTVLSFNSAASHSGLFQQLQQCFQIQQSVEKMEAYFSFVISKGKQGLQVSCNIYYFLFSQNSLVIYAE